MSTFKERFRSDARFTRTGLWKSEIEMLSMKVSKRFVTVKRGAQVLVGLLINIAARTRRVLSRVYEIQTVSGQA